MTTKRAPSGTRRPPPPDGGAVADRRAEFARLTRQSPRDEAAERAFIESKIEVVKGDTGLGEEARKEAIEKLEQELQRLSPR